MKQTLRRKCQALIATCFTMFKLIIISFTIKLYTWNVLLEINFMISTINQNLSLHYIIMMIF